MQIRLLATVAVLISLGFTWLAFLFFANFLSYEIIYHFFHLFSTIFLHKYSKLVTLNVPNIVLLPTVIKQQFTKYSLLLNCFVWHAMQNTEIAQIILGIFAFIVGILTRDWYRLHGEKLTRALKALLNVSNMLNSLEYVLFLLLLPIFLE